MTNRTTRRLVLAGFAASALLSLGLAFAPAASAQVGAPRTIILAQATNSSGASSAPRRTSLNNPLGTSSIQVLIGRAVYLIMGLSGSFALLMFVYGAFTWVTSAGSPEKITKGKKIFVWATIGLFVIFGSYAFLKYFIDVLGTSTL